METRNSPQITLQPPEPAGGSVLIFGRLGLPLLGVVDAAVATIISQAVFIAIALRSLASEKRIVRFRFANLALRWESVKRVLDIGIPAALTRVIFPLGLAALTFVTSLGFLEPGAVPTHAQG